MTAVGLKRCLVSGATNRHPGTFAKIAATVDHLSGGRLDVGLDAVGDALTDAMMGTPTPSSVERVERLAETCETSISCGRARSPTSPGGTTP